MGRPAPFIVTLITTFLIILLFTALISQSHARPKSPSSLVLGLTHSRTALPRPAASEGSALKPLEMLDMLEPLREVRDGYLISLKLGTPPQVIQVYLDTGSDLTWVPCGNITFDCIDCDDYRSYRTMATFSPFQSSSALRDLCTSPLCMEVHSSDNSYDPCIVAGCSLSTLLGGSCRRPCPSFSYTYGAGGIVTGSLTRDTLRVHGSSPNVFRDISSFLFGCVGVTYKEPLGIAGFGRGALSLPSQLGLLQKGFSHCFLAFKFVNNPNISSPLVIGDLAISSQTNLQFTPMLRSPMYPNYYYIGLEAISVGNISTIEVPPSLRGFDSNGNGGFLIDSGTTYTHLPQLFYKQLLSILQSVITLPRSPELETRTGFDLCYKVPCLSNKTALDNLLPLISFHFLNNVTLVLPKENYFYAMVAPSNSSVGKCFLFQTMDDGAYGPSGVFGSFQQQNVEVVYDLEKERLGFQPMDCAYSATSQGLLYK